MASTTTAKKEIVDFLWDWAEHHGDWGKLIVNKIVCTEDNLSPQDRQEIFNYYLQSISLYTGLSAISVTKPTYSPTSKLIELTSLGEVSGVNRLAKDQAVAGIEVGLHPLGEHHQPRQQSSQAAHHVMRQLRRVGQHHTFH